MPATNPSPSVADQTDPCPANVSLAVELMGAINASGGSAGARLGFSRPPAIISLPETPDSPTEFRPEDASDSSPTVLSASVNTISSMSALNQNVSPAQGVVVTLTIPDTEPDDNDLTSKHCNDSFGQPVIAGASSTAEPIISEGQQLPGTTMPSQQIYLPLVSVATAAATTVPATMNAGEFSTGSESLQNENPDCRSRLGGEVWRDHVR